MDNSGNVPTRRKRKAERPDACPEEIWIRELAAYAGTDNITQFRVKDLGGVPLARIIEALIRGNLVIAEKCDGPGTVCTMKHDGDDDSVSVTVWFEAGRQVLRILKAWKLREIGSEPDAA